MSSPLTGRHSSSLKILAFLVATFATALVTFTLSKALSLIVKVPSALEVADKYGILKMFAAGMIKPEPVENLTFLIATGLAFSFLFLAALWCHRHPVASWSTTSVVVASVGVCVIFGWLFLVDWSTLFPESNNVVSAARLNPQRFALVTIAAFCAICWIYRLAFLRQIKYLPILIVAIPLLALSRLVLLGMDDSYIGTTHYEVFAYPIVQDWLGAGIHIAQKSQYGMYPLFLRPLWHLTGGPSTLGISITMSGLLFLSNIAVVLFVCRFSRNISLVATVGFYGVCTALLLFPFWPGDTYFEFLPVRLVFPALALALLCFSTTRDKYRFTSYSILAFGLLWNFESGIVGIAVFVTFALATKFEPSFSRVARLILGEAAQVFLAVCVAAFNLCAYYLLRFGELPDLTRILSMIQAFSAGIGAEPIPIFGGWILHALIYAAALFVGFNELFKSADRNDRLRSAALLSLAVMGILWLKYYQGRSLPLPLALVSTPAICCVGLLLDRVDLQRYKRGAFLNWFMPAVLIAPLLAALYVWFPVAASARPMRAIHTEHSDSRWKKIVDKTLTTFEAAKERSDDRLLVLAPYTQLVQLQLNSPSPVHAAGICQIWFDTEVEEIIESLSDEKTRMVLIDHTGGCRSAALLFDERINEILKSNFEEISMQENCSLMPDQFRRLYLRRGSAQLIALLHMDRGELRDNIAFKKSTSQSSVYLDSKSSLAVDGNTDGNFAAMSVSHTERGLNPWWEVDLGDVMDIDAVQIWNRTDCCSERMRDVKLILSNQSFLTESAVREPKPAHEFESLIHSAPCPMTEVAVHKKARYVRFQLSGWGYMSVAEVKVLAPPAALKKWAF